MNNQINIFDILYPKYKITKPIRLIEFFAGYGSQALALKYLGVKFEHWKTCEWAIKSIQAYKDIHFTNETLKGIDIDKLKEEEIKEYLYTKGISSNYNEPMTKQQIDRLGYKQCKKILENIYITHNLVNIQQVKGKDLDIVDRDKYEYILTYSFPCQDLSLAGKGKGMSDTSTRSGMLWEVERILTECYELGSLPQILLMENVPQVHGVDNVKDFNKWQLRLEELGYKNYFQDLIATDYGIPQTRNRCFMISILGDYSYTFPTPIPLKLKLKDLLEENVDEKYYLSDRMIKGFLEYQGKIPKREIFLKTINQDELAKTLTCGDNTRATDNYILVKDTENYIEWKEKGKLDIDCRAYKEDKVSATICTTPKNKVLIKNATKKGYLEAEVGDGIDISGRMQHHRGTVQKQKSQTISTMGGEDVGVVVNDTLKRDLCNKLIQDGLVEEGDVVKHSYTQQILDGNKKCVEKNDGNMITLTTRGDCVGVCVGTYQYSKSDTFMHGKDRLQLGKETSDTLQTTPKEGIVNNDLRIRKLTPYECFALMGVKREDYENCAKNQSDSSLYHLAGDSIVVNVLMAIFKELI